MHWLAAPDLAVMFVPTRPIVETILRGTIMYLGILILLRVVLKRQSTALATADLLVVVVLADAAQNGMAGQYNSITEGLILIVTILLWDYAVDWMAFHSKTFGRWLHPSPLMLIHEGKLQRRAMRRELVSFEELRTRIHEEGLEDLADVKSAWIEGDGSISIIARKGN